MKENVREIEREWVVMKEDVLDLEKEESGVEVDHRVGKNGDVVEIELEIPISRKWRGRVKRKEIGK